VFGGKVLQFELAFVSTTRQIFFGAERESAKKKLQLDGELGRAVAAAKML